MADVVYAVVPVLAVVLAGLFAGLFFAFSVAVMPGLARTGDRVMVEAMQRINVAILNPFFAVVFIGAPVAALAQTVLYAAAGAPGAAAAAGGASAAQAVVLAVTFAVNVPRNNALEAAGPADRLAEPAAVRSAFEGVWVRWNHVRTLVSLVALVCAAAALALF
ncbi:DUF1772 domain-containing protein [Nocardiopsis algeriensis]|uniref:Putative membrane protein n=1 Tax=Nocardiopsis algeriensis TaxID=1478215 RepID=A0A841IP02_9ACTN|nr:anthrone oxygenase family protein [Nocardiopsis algeriensis]MBB6119920.1 putative membrane protein [Nocardiopsis algeriensis]